MDEKKINFIDFKLSKEQWNDNNIKINALSSVYWGNHGARAGLLRLPFEVALNDIGFHYSVINGGLIDGRSINEQVRRETEHITGKGSKEKKADIRFQIIENRAYELANIIPRVEKPVVKKNDSPFLGIYIIPSLMIDGHIGSEILMLLQPLRKDLHIYRMGCDYTYLKKNQPTPEEIEAGQVGQIVGWLNPKTSDFRSKYASAPVDNAFSRTERTSTKTLPAFWMVGGYGSNLIEPRGGSRKRDVVAQPVLHIPTPREVGAVSVDMNQIGFQIVESEPDGIHRTIHFHSLRDIVHNENQLIQAPDESNKLQKRIINTLKNQDGGLSVGMIAQALKVDKDNIKNELDNLAKVEVVNDKFPGLLFDKASARYAFKNDWFQNSLNYKLDYEKEKRKSITRMIFGCAHFGSPTTDYYFMRHRFPEIALRHNIDIAELSGDAIQGLKHEYLAKGQVLSNMNYDDQVIFCGEAMATWIYEVFETRLRYYMSSVKINKTNLTEIIKKCLIKFVYIKGNHDEWPEGIGSSPLSWLKTVIRDLLFLEIMKLLSTYKLYAENLMDIINEKIIYLWDDKKLDYIYFYDGIQIQLMHPHMGRASTTSLRLEHAMSSSNAQLVTIANFHTAVAVELWSQEVGQRVGIQAGTMMIGSRFEKNMMKNVDFGPIIAKSDVYEGRIIKTEKVFYNQPCITEAYDRFTNPNTLKDNLGLLRYRL